MDTETSLTHALEETERLGQEFLGQCGAVLFVTHDRAFLRRLATRIVELDHEIRVHDPIIRASRPVMLKLVDDMLDFARLTAGKFRVELVPVDARPILEEAADFFVSHREYSDLPRKHKITISACPHQCNAPEIHCIALLGALGPRRPVLLDSRMGHGDGYAVWRWD